VSEIRQIVGHVLFPVALLLASGTGCIIDPNNPGFPGGGTPTYDAGVQNPGSGNGGNNQDGNPSNGGGSQDPGQPGSDEDPGDFEPGDEPGVDAGTDPTEPGDSDDDGDSDPGQVDPDPGPVEPEPEPEPEPDIPAWDARPDQGVGNGSDVITIGDSWIHNTLLTGEAISGALKRAGKRYRNYAQQGVMLLQDSLLFGKAIPKQFDDALRENRNIKTVIMAAGGNDIIQTAGMQEDCRNNGNRCKQKLKEIGEALKQLWAKMAANGVQDVVHITYATDAGSSGPYASDASKNGVLEICNAAPLNCHILETTALVRGDYILDGIHPTRAANDRIAKAILELMEKRKMRR
jgi:lysophospholipase L1-like esterase